jgi:diaminopimelate decarboxylase
MGYQQDEFSIQGIAVSQLCEQFGSPIYVYDASKIIEKISILKQSFANVNLKIKFACKALSNINILKLMKSQGVGLDVVSPQELELALLAGFDAADITFTPSGVSWDEIELAVAKGVIVNLDNLVVLERFGQQYGHSVPCMIRLKPNIAAGGNHKIMTAHEGSKFGISILQIPEILAISQKYNLQIIGLHQHTGSDIKEAEAFLAAAQALYNVAPHFPHLQQIDFGGGFKVPYLQNDPQTDMEQLGTHISASFQAFCRQYGRPLQIWFEPGKFLVSEAGYLFAKANVVKHDPNYTFIGLNTGLNHLIRPMMYDAYHHLFNASNINGSQQNNYTVVGYICETDTFGSNRSLNTVHEGDIIGIANAGAYGFTMASNYNSRPRPAEVLIENGKARLIRKEESLTDLLANQVY